MNEQRRFAAIEVAAHGPHVVPGRRARSVSEPISFGPPNTHNFFPAATGSHREVAPGVNAAGGGGFEAGCRSCVCATPAFALGFPRGLMSGAMQASARRRQRLGRHYLDLHVLQHERLART